ncbi:uncharacterized protein SPPG_05451 [Spizellomyces punctatus DAOM BR117]|uniref:Serine/threonine-protein kinase Tel1 n=1 Tax=Spizellomyces punctatus (strain DAOM BR117) TaxID=645134 RepID=A0A0L0HCC3_SPIPD|nr:uncharacterized protein SPPG_05451 [Spizellomyces punctatus DAOM BR117]KNC99195.1 hypothetical protein SPPG_05451 [Spizellomyces punctatus DAOM BR117]|eukprot:XP_016607235.1 hypothetical protein SPPG_05451 [Spizellomyces punctatus DAOM BR117]
MTIEFTLRNALSKIDSEKAKDRDSGLATLKTLLSDDRNVLDVDEGTWKTIFESFCRCVEKQKALFLTKSSGTSKASSQNAAARAQKALSELGQDFRWLCERAHRSLKCALVRPILEHILAVLPYRHGLFKPLAVSYTRALRQMLSCRSYRDHIPLNGWDALTNLCMNGLNAEDEDGDSSSGFESVETPSPTSLPNFRSSRRSTSADSIELARIMALLVIGCPKDLGSCADSFLEFFGCYFARHLHETPCHTPLLTATNHLLFETAHQNMQAVEDFLSTAIPHLLPLWESRSNHTFRYQLLCIMRFYLHVASTTNPAPDWQTNCSQIYECVQREMSSKFGFGPLSSIALFVWAIRKRQPDFLVPITKEDLLVYNHISPKDMMTFAFLDLCSDVFFHVLALEAKPEKDQTHGHDITPAQDDVSDTLSKRKKTKRSDVVADITRILALKAASKDEKIALLQAVTLLLVKHGSHVSEKLSNVTASLSSIAAGADIDLQGWALICLGIYGMSADSRTFPFTGWEIAWNTSVRLMVTDTPAAEAAFYAMEVITEKQLISEEIIVGAKAEILRAMRDGVLVPSPGSLHFLLRYIEWTTAAGDAASGDQAFPIQEVASWVLAPSNASSNTNNLSRNQLITPRILASLLLSLCGVPSTGYERTFDAVDAVPVRICGGEEHLSEWRLSLVKILWKDIVNEDFEHLSKLKSQVRVPLPKDRTGLAHQGICVLKGLEEHLQNLLSCWDRIEISKVKPSAEQSDTLGRIVRQSLDALSTTIFVSRRMSYTGDTARRHVNESNLALLLSAIAARLNEGLRQLNGCDSFVGILERLVQILTECHDCMEGDCVAPTSVSTRPAETHWYPLWPMPVDTGIALMAVMQAMFHADVKRRGVANNQTTKSSTAAFDEFDSPDTTVGGGSGAVITSLQMEYFYGTSSTPVGTVIERDSLMLRAMRLLYSMNWGQAASAELGSLRNMIENTVATAIPTDTVDLFHLGFEIVDFLECASAIHLTTDQCRIVIERSADLLSTYDSERNQWVWIYIIRSLKSLLPALVKATEEADLTDQVGSFLAYFMKKVSGNTVCWRVCLELGQLLLRYLLLDPGQGYFRRCLGSDSKDSALVIVLGLLTHEEFIVRIRMGHDVPKIFGIFDPEDHSNIFNDIHDTLAKNCFGYLHLLSNILTLGEVFLVTEQERASVLLSLLHMSKEDDAQHMVEAIIEVVAHRLSLKDGTHLLSELLPHVLWAWDDDIGKFPFGLLTIHSASDFFIAYAEHIVPKLLLSSDFDSVRTLIKESGGDALRILKRALPWSMAYLLPRLIDGGLLKGRIGQSAKARTAEAAIRFMKDLMGDEMFNIELTKRTPRIIANLLKSVFDSKAMATCIDDSEYSILSEALQRMSVPATGSAAHHSCLWKHQYLPSFDSRTIIQSLEYLQTLYQEDQRATTGDCTSALHEFFKPGRLQRVLQDLHESLDQMVFVHDKHRLISNGYRLVVAISAPALMHPFLFETVLQTLLQNMKYPEMSSVCCVILEYLYSFAVANDQSVIGSTLTSIAPALAEQISTYLASNTQEAALRVKTLLDSILDLCWKVDQRIVTLSILQLDSNLSLFEGLRDRHGATKCDGDPQLVLSLVALGDATASAQLARVRYLRRALESTDLVNRLRISEDTVSVVIAHLQAMLHSTQCDDVLTEEIVKCLGRLSPVVTHRAVKYDYSISRHLGNTGPVTRKLAVGSPGHRVALSYLQKHLMDSDVKQVSIVVRTLRQLLSCDAGNYAFESLELDVSKYINIFRGKIAPKTKVLATQRAYPPLEDLDVSLPTSDTSMHPNAHIQTFDDWTVTLANSLIASYPTDEFYPNLGLCFEFRPAFADMMLPYLIHSALLFEAETIKGSTKRKLPMSLRTLLSEKVKAIMEQNQKLDSRILSSLLNVIEFLRTQPHPCSATPFDNNAWLDLDFLCVAQAAAKTRSFATALLFLEISQEKNKRLWAPALPINQTNQCDTQSLARLLLDVYQAIGDSDGFEGVMTSIGSETMLDDPSSLVQKYEHDRAWQKLFSFRETQLQVGHIVNAKKDNLSIEIGLMKSLGSLGFHHVLDTYIRGYSNQQQGTPMDQQMRELHYESLWRTARWEMPTDRARSGHPQSQEHLYNCMKAFNDRDLNGLSSFLSSALRRMGDVVRGHSLRGTLNPFPVIRPLLMFTELDELASVAKAVNIEALQSLMQRWKLRIVILSDRQSFPELEPVLASRTSTLSVLVSQYCTHKRSDDVFSIGATRALCEHFLGYAELARKAGNLQIANAAHARLSAVVANAIGNQLLLPTDKLQALMKLEGLKSLWAQDDRTVATRSLKHFLQLHANDQARTTGVSLSRDIEAELLYQLGQWVAETRFEPPTTILKDYFEPAVQASALTNYGKLRAKAHYHLAKFADGQYQELLVNDPREQIREHVRYKQSEANACEDLSKQYAGRDANAAKRYAHIREKMLSQIKLDMAEEGRYMDDRNTFLEKSVENYLQSLEYGHTHSEMCVFRLCTLWFANVERNQINAQMLGYIERIQSWKFLVLMYQLSARLTSRPPAQEAQFQSVLQRLIYKMTKDHPHHTLYQIIALKNGNQYGSPSSSRQRTPESTPTVTAAKGLLQKLSAPEALGDLVTRVDRLCDAYIELAWRVISTAMLKESRVLPLDKRSKIAGIAKYGLDVPIATVEHPVNRSCRYDDLPRIQGFKGNFAVPGGINMPKRVDCVGTDGNIYTQLVKGNDDLRQDAVLSKIFTIMNVLLNKNLETRKRNLTIRTYKVVPLAPRAGLVEWVHNTLPIGEYLSKAHVSYNPKDWRPSECRARMNEEHKKGNLQTKITLYRQIEGNFHPVFRHFFFETFPDPLDWFERRLTYTRSVAASSMAGYVVGLGDRHAQNILIDKGTAEVVHIDLGIAFDQGRILAVPELVPFRLTRDIVDGMGITGVEGAFRRCCEETMKVLRNDSEILLTILDVFRYDPLYNWKVTPLEQRRRQGAPEEQVAIDIPGRDGTVIGDDRGQNKEAERALFVVRKKLSSGVSVECQINELIQTAVDPGNLSRMYHGWQPWM